MTYRACFSLLLHHTDRQRSKKIGKDDTIRSMTMASLSLKDDDLIVGLKVFSTVAAGLFTGGSWMMIYGSVPAAMSLRASCLLKVTKSVLPRSSPILAAHTVSTLASAGVFLASSRSENEMGWLVASGIMGTLLPHSFFFLKPIDEDVLENKVKEEEAHSTMDYWWNHLVLRTLVASGCFLYFSYRIAKN